MAKLVGIFGPSGDGKTTSTIINPDGSFDLRDTHYKGMDPKSHFIINLDRKALPFPAGMWSTANKNYLETSDFDQLKKALQFIAKQEHIKSISIDTINVYLAMKEFNERKKMTFDKWADYANDVIELNSLCNTLLREDQIVYIFGHTMDVEQNDGTNKKVLSVSGKKLQRTPPEGFYPIILMTRVQYGDDGQNEYFFQTKANYSSAKTPLGMFQDFEIPNSLSLVDEIIRKYYMM